MTKPFNAISVHEDEFMGEELTPWQRTWRNLAHNPTALVSGVVLALFFAVALLGWWGTSGRTPYFRPSVVRLPDKLLPPFSSPNELVPRENLPRLGYYLFGTDELGRDVFARMLEGATTAMAVGFVAVGIAVILGVTMGGIAGFYGERNPGGPPLLGFLAMPVAGFAVWNAFGALPALGSLLGAAAGVYLPKGRTRVIEGLVAGLLLGTLLPGGAELAVPAQNAQGLAYRLPASWEVWLAWFAALAAFGVAGAHLGTKAERDRRDAVQLGALSGAAAGYFALAAWAIFGPYPGAAFHWALALVLAAAGAALALRPDAGRLLRRLRLPRVDTLFVMLVDVQISFPSFFLILTVIALLPPSIWNIMIVIGLTGWVGPARFVRAEILSLRERPFIEAAQAMGGNDARIIFRHLVPNSLAPVLVSATIGIASAILVEAGLSFLGFGVPPPQATWGNILSDGKKYLFDAPWLTFIPGFAILIVVLAFNLFGEGLRDALNPRVKPK